MKKTTKTTIAVLAAAALLCAGGCGNTSVQDTNAEHTSPAKNDELTAADTQETEHTSADAQPEETVSYATPEETVSETSAEDNAAKTSLYTLESGETFYLEDASARDEYTVKFDYAYVSEASGVYDDTFANPGAFDASSYSCNGEMSIDSAVALTKIKAGDEFGGYKISSAQTKLMLSEYEGETQAYLFSQEIVISGEYTLSGLLLHYCGDEYGVSAGDVKFVPDASAKGLPLPYAPYPFFASIFDNFGGTLGVYTDSPFFALGNIISEELSSGSLDESGNWVMDKMDEKPLSELNSIFGTDKENRAVRANVTFSEVKVSWSDQFGMNRSMMAPMDVSVIN